MNIQNIKTAGKSIQTAEVAGVEAEDVLSAEYLAERALNRHAEREGLVNSTSRWEITALEGETYTIKFS